NILTAIGGHAQLASHEAPAGSPLATSVGEILKAHERARALVRRILLFSRRDEPAERAIIRIRPVLDEALDLLRASIPKNVEIRVSSPSALPTILADATQMHQVLMNLGTNAAYAMRER